MTEGLKAPFPWFGGKSRCAHLVWERFGDVKHYVEPFFGSGATLLARPGGAVSTETVNDLDGYLANFWRSVKLSPESTAEWASNPVNECDLHARQVWLLKQRGELPLRLMGDPDYHDPKIAGWWAWGLCSWIGTGWCSGNGPWWPDDSGMLAKRDAGRGVNKQLPHLGDAGRGVNKQLPHLGNSGQGVNKTMPLKEWFTMLSERMARTRVACGDWQRVCGPSVLFGSNRRGPTGVFLDPPYGGFESLYSHGGESVAEDVRLWAIDHGANPALRIALCGYDGMAMPDSWECVAWQAAGGYGTRSGNDNNRRERIWLSPGCVRL